MRAPRGPKRLGTGLLDAFRQCEGQGRPRAATTAHLTVRGREWIARAGVRRVTRGTAPPRAGADPARLPTPYHGDDGESRGWHEHERDGWVFKAYHRRMAGEEQVRRRAASGPQASFLTAPNGSARTWHAPFASGPFRSLSCSSPKTSCRCVHALAPWRARGSPRCQIEHQHTGIRISFTAEAALAPWAARQLRDGASPTDFDSTYRCGRAALGVRGGLRAHACATQHRVHGVCGRVTDAASPAAARGQGSRGARVRQVSAHQAAHSGGEGGSAEGAQRQPG